MSIATIADTIYLHSKKIIVDHSNNNEAIFTRQWLKDFNYNDFQNVNGWYWISTSMPSEKFMLLQSSKRKLKGCDIKKVVSENLNIFSERLISKTHFYNGHADKIVNRLRSHFNLTNDSTGALGLNAYDELKNEEIYVQYFTIDCLEHSGIDKTQMQLIENLIKGERGRTAIENAWRTKNGFPVLCKY